MAAAFRFPAYTGSNFINSRRYLNNPYTSSYSNELTTYANYFRTTFPAKNPGSLTSAQILQWVSRFAGNYYNFLENPVGYLGVDGGALWSAGMWNGTPLVVLKDFALHGFTPTSLIVGTGGASIFLSCGANFHGLYDGMQVTISSSIWNSGGGWSNAVNGATWYVKKADPTGAFPGYSDPHTVQLFQNSSLTTPVTTPKPAGTYTASFTSTGSSISGTTLTIGTLTFGTPQIGMEITGGTTRAGTFITGNISGSGNGSTWTVTSPNQTVASSALAGGSGNDVVIAADETFKYKLSGNPLTVWKGSLSSFGGQYGREVTDTVFGISRTIQVPYFKRGFIPSIGGSKNIVSIMNNPQWLSGDQVGSQNMNFEKSSTGTEQESIEATVAADITAGYLPAGTVYTIGSGVNPYLNQIRTPASYPNIGHQFNDTVSITSVVGNVVTVSSLSRNKIMIGNTLTGTLSTGDVFEEDTPYTSKTAIGPRSGVIGSNDGSSYINLTSVSGLSIGSLVSGAGIVNYSTITEIDQTNRRLRLSKALTNNIVDGATVSFSYPGCEIIAQLTSTFTTNQGSTTITAGGTAGSSVITVASATNILVGDIISGTGIPSSTEVTDVDGSVITISNGLTATASGTYLFRRAGQSGTYRLNRSFLTAGASTASVFDDRYSLGYYPKLICVTGPTDDEVSITGGFSTTTQDQFDGLIPAEYPGRFSTTAPVAIFFTGIPDNYRWRWATQANDAQWEKPWETTISNQDFGSTYDDIHNSEVKQWPRTVRPQSMTWSIEQPTRVVESQNLTRWARDSGVRRWKFKLNYPPMTREQFMPFMTAIHTAHGQARGFRFYIGDIAGFTQMQNKGGFVDTTNASYASQSLRDMVCYSNDANPAGDTFLTLDGFRPRVNNALNAGDMIKIQHYSATNGTFYHPYVIINTADSDEMGRCRIRLSHPLIDAVGVGSAHHVNPSQIWVTLTNDQQDIDISTAHLYGFTVEFVTQTQYGQTGYENRGLVT